MRKYASLEVLEAWQQPAPGRGAHRQGIARLAHRVAFDYEPRPGYLYVRSRMISSRTNDNHDTFPAGEIEKGYRTFLGKPVFVNHHNANHRRARGVIVAVALHRDRNADSSPDTWVEGLMEVDAVKFPKLAKAILAGRVNRTSMGVDVEWSRCSACGNKATSPAEYCKHLPAMKGKKIRQRNMKTGKVEETLIHEVCAGLSFFENSLLVEDPADPSAFVLGTPDARGLQMSPRSASANRSDRSGGHTVPAGYVRNGALAAPGRAPVLPGRYQGQKFVFDDPDLGVGELDSRVAYARQATPLSHHVGRVDRVGAQEPVPHVHAEQEVARVADRQTRRNRAAQQLPPVAVRPDARTARVRQGEAGVPVVERPSRPRIARAKLRAEVDQGQPPLYFRDRSHEASVQLGPADHGVNGSTAYLLGKPDARGLGKAAAKTAAAEPDFRDHLSNTCTTCGDPVFWLKGNPRRGTQGQFRHERDAGPTRYDHPASPSDPSSKQGRMVPSTFGGTRCLACGDDVKINLRALDTESGGWHHGDGLRRDHPAIPMDPQAVYDAVPRVRAAFDQAKNQVSDTLHRQFEQLSGHPLPRSSRGDEDRMPPDPFTASKTAAFSGEFTHCANCGHPFSYSGAIGDAPHPAFPFLCGDCARGHAGTESAEGKQMPLRPLDKGGTEGNPFMAEYYGYGDPAPDAVLRNWQPSDAPLQSQSARKQRPKKSRWPQPVRGYGNDPRFDGVGLKRDGRGFYVHTHRSRSDSYPTPGDIPDADIDYIRSTGAKKAEGGDHPWFRAHPVHPQHIIDSYHGSTEDERALGDRWYSDAHHVAKVMGKGDAALGAGVLSAYSVRTLWPVNLFNASRAFHGDPPGPGTGAMGVHQKAAVRILGGEHHTKVLTAPKTAAFAHLIEHGGDSGEDKRDGTQRVVIDRHAMSVAVGHRLTDTEKEGMPIGQHQHYEHVAKAYREAAAHLSGHYGREIAPHQVQAATWLHQIRKNTGEDASGRQGGGGKGRVQLGDNSRTRWQERRRQHHPDIPEENLHYHGAWAERPDYCTECGSPMMAPDDLRMGDDQFRPRSSQIPHLCTGCADPRSAPYQRTRAAEEMPRVLRGTRPWRGSDSLPPSQSSRKTAYGETRVPPQVDTLRMDECPVCGEHNVWSGSRCPVCGFVVPPSVFRDPDTSKAQQVRDQLDSSGDVTLPPDQGDAAQPDGALPPAAQQAGSGDDADAQLIHPDQIAPDGVPTVQGGGDADFDAEDDGVMPPGDEELAANDPGADAEMQEDEAEAETADGLAVPEGEEDPGEQMYAEELVCPACGTTFEADAAAQPGVPCPACGMAALHPADEGEEPPEGEEDPGDPRKEQEDPSDPDEKAGDEQDEEDEDEDMPESKTAAAVARAQARRIAELTARNEVLETQLRFLASAAGVDREFAEIDRQVMRRHADILNPASPVPDPPQAPPAETTEQALAPEAMDNAGRPGTTPGANSRVPAAQTTTAITPGVEMQTPPATNLIDVTAPVQGTNPSQDGGVPIQQRRIETDVRIDPDPLKAHGPGIGGQGDNGAAFPWILDARKPANDPAQRTAVHEADASRRTFASIRLARMRVQAGLAQGDELAVAEQIEKSASLPTELIEHEIGVLARVPAMQPQAPRPMQRAAARAVPSLASVGASQYASAASYGEDDASDLFD